MTGIQYITDQTGKRIGVQIDLREHGPLWEDFYDRWLAQQSADDTSIPWDEAKRQLHEKNLDLRRLLNVNIH